MALGRVRDRVRVRVMVSARVRVRVRVGRLAEQWRCHAASRLAS